MATPLKKTDPPPAPPPVRDLAFRCSRCKTPLDEWWVSHEKGEKGNPYDDEVYCFGCVGVEWIDKRPLPLIEPWMAVALGAVGMLVVIYIPTWLPWLVHKLFA